MAGAGKGGRKGGGSGGGSRARELEAKRRQGKNKIDGAKPTEMDTFRDSPRSGVSAVQRSMRKQSGTQSRSLRRTENSY